MFQSLCLSRVVLVSGVYKKISSPVNVIGEAENEGVACCGRVSLRPPWTVDYAAETGHSRIQR